jgi:zeaxanthin glucosyltransferase
MHFAFIAPPFLGHMHPMLALAGELVARGHAATFLHMEDAGPLVAGRGVGFRPVGRGSHPPGTLAA